MKNKAIKGAPKDLLPGHIRHTLKEYMEAAKGVPE